MQSKKKSRITAANPIQFNEWVEKLKVSGCEYKTFHSGKTSSIELYDDDCIRVLGFSPAAMQKAMIWTGVIFFVLILLFVVMCNRCGEDSPTQADNGLATPSFANTSQRLSYNDLLYASKSSMIEKYGEPLDTYKSADCDDCTHLVWNNGELEIFFAKNTSYKFVYTAIGAANLNPAQLIGISNPVFEDGNSLFSEWSAMNGQIIVKAVQSGSDHVITCSIN